MPNEQKSASQPKASQPKSGQPESIEPKYGVMICGHGSRSKSAVREFAVLADKLAPYFPDWPVDYGYLEFATPVIKPGWIICVPKG